MRMTKTSITVKEFLERVESGYYELDFSNENQVQDIGRDSWIIFSMIKWCDGTSLYFTKKDDGSYYSCDDIQYGIIIAKYINGDFSLSDDIPSICEKQCNPIKISGKKFNELSEKHQDLILNSTLIIHCFEEVTTDDRFRFVYRLATGKGLTVEQLEEMKETLTEEQKEFLLKKIEQIDPELYVKIKKNVDGDRIYEG